MTPTEKQIADLQAQVKALTARTGEHKAVIERMGRDVRIHEEQLRPVRSSPLVNRKQADAMYGPEAMRKHLAADGVAPLHLAGLKGSAGEAQPARIPEVEALPQLGDSNVKQGTVLHHKGTDYRRGKAGWEPLGAK
jgi:hypothetical protein